MGESSAMVLSGIEGVFEIGTPKDGGWMETDVVLLGDYHVSAPVFFGVLLFVIWQRKPLMKIVRKALK